MTAELEITGLKWWTLQEPFLRRRYTVLRIETKGGLTGFGEGSEVSPADLEHARRVLMGKPAAAYEAIARDLAAVPLVQAAIDIALLDITGKAAKAPIYQVLGGPTRYRVRALTALEGTSNDELIAALHERYRAGFRAFTVPMPAPNARNQGQAFARAVRDRLERLRAAAGEADFVLDGAALLTPGDASSVAAVLEPLHLLWFDEPCPITNLAAVRKISNESVTPLGFGRFVGQSSEVQDALRSEVLDILRPNLARHGISRIRRMAALAETYYIAVAPYHDGGPIATAAALHLAASLPNFFIQQIPAAHADTDRRMRADLAGPVETVRDGFASLPTGPGLGIHVNQQALEKYAERAL